MGRAQLILRFIAVGRLRERYWQEAAADFTRRLRPYARLEMVEIPAYTKETAGGWIATPTGILYMENVETKR